MNTLTIQEVGTRLPLLRLHYPVIKSHEIPRVGEYIRIPRKDVPRYIVRSVSYSYFISGLSELDFDVTLFVESVKGFPPLDAKKAEEED